jgi:hypothetical protein
MVKIVSPARLKGLRGRLAVLCRLLTGEIGKKELFDTDKMVAISLKGEESMAFIDKDDRLWELSKNTKGRYAVRRLKDRRHRA